MFKSLLTKGILAAVLAVVAFSNISAQVFWSENFTNQASSTTNWVHSGTNAAPSNRTWQWTNNPDAGGWNGPWLAAGAATGHFYFDSDSNGVGAHDVRLTNLNAPINCTGKNNVKLKFRTFYRTATSTDAARVGISTNGTDFTYLNFTQFDNLAANAAFDGTIEVNLPQADNQPQVWIQFRWEGDFEYYWKVDDIELSTPVGPVPCNMNPDAIICDNFDAYLTTLKLGPQATWWTTWSGVEGTTEDGIVTTEQAASGTNSLKIVSTAATGGPQDVVLNLGSKTTGHYALNWKMFVPTGKKGYYNIQNIVPVAAGDWNLDVFFDANGAGRLAIGATPLTPVFTYPNGAWFTVTHDIDLDNNLLTLRINGNFVIKMPFARNLGGIDFFGIDNINQYYVDDVEYIKLPDVVYNVDICAGAIDLSSSLGGAAGVPTNVGPFDITTATLDASDPTTGFECHFSGDPLQNTQWFTFTGDGNTYSITSASCGASPIVDNDTQFALYTGECGNYVPVDCNDDVSGSDLSSTLVVETVSGTTYFLMVDSYQGLNGTYCLNIEQFASVDCAAAVLGANAVSNDGFVCNGGNLADIMDFDAASYVIPNLGPVAGHLWCITTDPVDPTVWPGTIAGIASTGAGPSVIAVNLINDGAAFPAGTYYLTSVIVAGGTLIDPAGIARVFNIDPTGGCFFVGESHQFTLVPAIDPIVAFWNSTPGTAANTVNIELTVDGGIAAFLGDPSFYGFNWSNGATTQDLTGVPNTPNYTVTITDPTGCVDPFVLTDVSTVDPASVKALTITPNPTTGLLNLNLSLATSADVQIEIFNTLGQLMQTIQAGTTTTLTQTIDLTNTTSGLYTVRVRMGNDTAVRRISVQH